MGTILRARLFNTAMPGPTNNMLPEDIKPVLEPSEFRVHAAFSAEGKLTVLRKSGETSITEELAYDGKSKNLEVGVAFTCDFPVRAIESYNFRYSAESGTVLIFQVNEIS